MVKQAEYYIVLLRLSKAAVSVRGIYTGDCVVRALPSLAIAFRKEQEKLLIK
jgi:hypothetical protein